MRRTFPMPLSMPTSRIKNVSDRKWLWRLWVMGVTIKWLNRIDNRWLLTPEDKSHRQIALQAGDRTIGRVTWWQGIPE